MKRFYNYTFNTVCIYIIILSILSISNFELNSSYFTNNHNSNKDKIVNSDNLPHKEEIIEEENESINIVDKEDITKEEEEIKEPIPEKVEEIVNIIDTSSYNVISTETVNMSHYGHDCYGCTTGKTASGYYVGDGRLYYQDPIFGSVRVVAADNKYPLGTIIRLGYNGSKITAIVLDRGSGIGDNKKIQIDLLTSSNDEAYMLGIIKNTSLEVLRIGY